MKIVAACAVLLALNASAAVITPDTWIVVPDDRAGVWQRFLDQAGRALADGIEEATGMKLQVVKAPYVKPGQRGIYIGEEFAAKAGLLPKDAPLRDFQNVVAEKDGCVYLFGHDRPGAFKTSRPGWEHCVLPSVKAVCNFMEKEMGVAFLQLGPTGRDVPKRDRIEIADGLFRRENPTQISGSGRYHEMMNDIAAGIYGLGTIRSFGGHTYLDAVPFAKYHKDHPEYFPMVNGVRVSQNHVNALCISNPDCERLLVELLVRLMDEGAEYVQLGQNDGSDRCHCPECNAYGGVPAEDWGEKLWIFHRRIAEKCHELRPDKGLQIISYGATYRPPKTFTEFPPNVMIQMMGYTERDFQDWARYKVPRGFTNYVYLWGTYNDPGFTAKCSVPQMAKYARLFVRGHIKDVYRCGYGELFGTEGPEYYVFNQLLQHPELDEYKVFGEYIARSYGPAAADMQKFHELLDARVSCYTAMRDGTFRRTDGKFVATVPQHAADVLAMIYPPDVLKKLEMYLSTAERTKDLTDKQKRRLALVRKEFDYAKSLANVLHLYNAYLTVPSKESFRPLADALRARNEVVRNLFDEKGNVKKVDGWPELVPFVGYGDIAKTMYVNGSLRGRLSAPFGWDADSMLEKGVLPGATTSRAKAVRATKKPSVGDDFESGDWARLPWQELGGLQLEKIASSTKFKVMYDDTCVYIAIVASLKADRTFPQTGRDATCFRTDSIDMIVDPTCGRDRFFHFIWNPVANSYYDSGMGLFEDPLDPRYTDDWAGWNPDWTYANRREGDVWYSLVSLPYAAVKADPARPGDTWCLNIGRAAAPRDGDVDTLNEMEYSLWNPNFENRSLTNPSAMGVVTFE